MKWWNVRRTRRRSTTRLTAQSPEGLGVGPVGALNRRSASWKVATGACNCGMWRNLVKQGNYMDQDDYIVKSVCYRDTLVLITVPVL